MRRTTLRLTLALVGSVAALAAAGAQADERLLVQGADLLVVADRETACGEPVPITVRAADDSRFADGGARLQPTVDGVRAMLGFECARIPRLDITGEAGPEQKVVFRGMAGDCLLYT